jgi:hypothetical protein
MSNATAYQALESDDRMGRASITGSVSIPDSTLLHERPRRYPRVPDSPQ